MNKYTKMNKFTLQKWIPNLCKLLSITYRPFNKLRKLFYLVCGIFLLFLVIHLQSVNEKCHYTKNKHIAVIEAIRYKLQTKPPYYIDGQDDMCQYVNQRAPLNRSHWYLQQDGLFGYLNQMGPQVYVVKNVVSLSNISECCDDTYYHYTSNDCAALNKTTGAVIQDIVDKYNATCLEDLSRALHGVPLKWRLKSLDIGLPPGSQQDLAPSQHLLGFMVMLKHS